MTFNAGQTLTADALNAGFTAVTPLWVIKTSDETVTSNATPQNDDHLFLSPAVNTTYDVDLGIFHFANGSVIDMNCAFTFPALATLSIGSIGPDISLGAGTSIGTTQWQADHGDSSSPTTTFAIGTSSIAGGIFTLIRGTLVMGATAGTLQFQWAQNASNAAGLTVYTGSWLKLTPH